MNEGMQEPTIIDGAKEESTTPALTNDPSLYSFVRNRDEYPDIPLSREQLRTSLALLRDIDTTMKTMIRRLWAGRPEDVVYADSASSVEEIDGLLGGNPGYDRLLEMRRTATHKVIKSERGSEEWLDGVLMASLWTKRVQALFIPTEGLKAE